MPGRDRLAAELGVSPKSVQRALKILEQDGLLIPQGRGRSCKVIIPENHTPSALRIQFLLYHHNATKDHYMVEAIHELREAGHHAVFASKSLRQMHMDAKRVARFAKKIDTDAWVVCAASHEVLKWFSELETPVFALFGAIKGLSLTGTGPDKAPSVAAATRCLIDHGHRRISFMAGRPLRLPQPGKVVRTFLETLEAAEITTGAFNIPDWEESAEGFERVLDSLFKGPTPPTALIVDRPILYHATHHYLTRQGLRVPDHVSLVCSDGHPDLEWCIPSVAHIKWDTNLVIRRLLRWANLVAIGKDNHRKSLTQTEFVEGGSIGPAPKPR